MRDLTCLLAALCLFAGMGVLDFIRSHTAALPNLVKFALAMAILVGVPPLSRRFRLPAVVGLLLCGIVIGPHVLGVFPLHPYIADFFADLGKLLLMFFAGLEIDLALFRQVRRRSIAFGLLTTSIPLALGTVVGLWFGYLPVAAVVLGSLLASHTLLALPIITELGENRLEPVTVTVGATVMSDTLSLIVFAICAGIYHSGFSMLNLGVQLIEIAIFVPLVLFGLSRLGAYFLKKAENNEDSYFVLMLAIMVVAGVLAQSINLPGIVGAFLAGLAVNAAVHDKPAKGKLEFFANSLFIPIFFIVTGFLIDPLVFLRSLIDNFALACGVILALVVGKWIAAEIAGRAFHYSSAARLTVWSLTLPQVAATLAAALVAFDTFDRAGQRLIDGRLLNVVLVLMLTTAILGPVLTARFAQRMLPERTPENTAK
jgi:Kef-type K+ transport system membrane component KefB